MALPGLTNTSQQEIGLQPTTKDFSPVPQSMERVGGALEQLGGAISAVAVDARNRALEAKALELESEYQTYVSSMVFDARPDGQGFSRLKGEDALARYEEYKTGIEKKRAEMASKMPSLMQQRLFLANSQRILRFGQDHIDAHTARQGKLKQDAAYTGAIKIKTGSAAHQLEIAMTDKAPIGPDMLGNLNEQMLDVAEVAARRADVNGLDSEGTQALVDEARSGFADTLIRVASKHGDSAEDLEAAKQVYGHFKAFLGPKPLITDEAMMKHFGVIEVRLAARDIVGRRLDKATGVPDVAGILSDTATKLTDITDYEKAGALRSEVDKLLKKQQNVLREQSKPMADALWDKMREGKFYTPEAADADLAGRLKAVDHDRFTKLAKFGDQMKRAANQETRDRANTEWRNESRSHSRDAWDRGDRSEQRRVASEGKLGQITADLIELSRTDPEALKQKVALDYVDRGLSIEDITKVDRLLRHLHSTAGKGKDPLHDLRNIAQATVQRELKGRPIAQQDHYFGLAVRYLLNEHQSNPAKPTVELETELREKLQSRRGFLGMFGAAPPEIDKLKLPTLPELTGRPPAKVVGKSAPRAAPGSPAQEAAKVGDLSLDVAPPPMLRVKKDGRTGGYKGTREQAVKDGYTIVE
jgi:hypothetical protein